MGHYSKGLTRARLFSPLLFILIFLAFTTQGCSDKFDELRPGMTEVQIKNLMGQPYREEFVDRTSAATFQNTELLKKNPHLKLLIYERMFRDDVFIYLDPKDELVLKERVHYIEKY